MSAVAVQEFFEKLQTDESLAQELVKALEAENDRQAVADLATSKGYEVSSEELWTEVQKRQAELQQSQGEGELSDEELEAVAGGATPAKIITLLLPIVIGAIPPIKW